MHFTQHQWTSVTGLTQKDLALLCLRKSNFYLYVLCKQPARLFQHRPKHKGLSGRVAALTHKSSWWPDGWGCVWVDLWGRCVNWNSNNRLCALYTVSNSKSFNEKESGIIRICFVKAWDIHHTCTDCNTIFRNSVAKCSGDGGRRMDNLRQSRLHSETVSQNQALVV